MTFSIHTLCYFFYSVLNSQLRSRKLYVFCVYVYVMPCGFFLFSKIFFENIFISWLMSCLVHFMYVSVNRLVDFTKHSMRGRHRRRHYRVFLFNALSNWIIPKIQYLCALVCVWVCILRLLFFRAHSKPKFFGLMFFLLILFSLILFKIFQNNCYVLLSIKICSTTTIKVVRVYAPTSKTHRTQTTEINNKKWSVHYNYYHVCIVWVWDQQMKGIKKTVRDLLSNSSNWESSHTNTFTFTLHTNKQKSVWKPIYLNTRPLTAKSTRFHTKNSVKFLWLHFSCGFIFRIRQLNRQKYKIFLK